VVPVGGLEPPRLAARDFESLVYTNFTTPAFKPFTELANQLMRMKCILDESKIIAIGGESSIVILNSPQLCGYTAARFHSEPII
tara:strand:- start:15109 stop:15360 length:252 start_codon:yes stop_codon:yes gene_type:complete